MFFYKINKILLISTFLLLLLLSGIVIASDLIISPTPNDALIYINGEYKGNKPITIKEIAPRSYEIVVEKQGYYDWKKTIVVSFNNRILHPALVEIVPGNGRLQVSSNPEETKLFLDGYYRGHTPFDSVSIRDGKHKLTLTKPDYLDYSQDITIYSGKVTKIVCKLKSKCGKINLTNILLKAEIYLDGQKIDSYIKYFEKVPVGSHQIKIYKYGFQEWSQEITVNSGETTKIKITLIPAYGFIKINSQPDNAEVFLNNDYFGLIEKEKTLNDIFPDEYKITLTKTGYKDWTKEIEVFSYNTTFVSAQLEPWYVTLNLDSIPTNAQVYLNNKKIGVTPLVYTRLTYGEHQLRLEKEGYFTKQIDDFGIDEREDKFMDEESSVRLEKDYFDIYLGFSLVLPAIAILYYLFFLSVKRRKKEELPYTEKEEEQSLNVLEQKETEVIDELENNQENIIEELLETNKEEIIETIEGFHNNQKKDIHRGIKEKLPEQDKSAPDSHLTLEYQEIQEKMEEQAHVRTLLSQTQEEAEKAITQAKKDNNSSRLSSLKDLKQKINDLSQQFEYGKLSSEKVNNEIKLIKNQMKELSKKGQAIKGIKPKELNKKTREIREKKRE